jgi:hypothetical protein
MQRIKWNIMQGTRGMHMLLLSGVEFAAVLQKKLLEQCKQLPLLQSTLSQNRPNIVRRENMVFRAKKTNLGHFDHLRRGAGSM